MKYLLLFCALLIAATATAQTYVYQFSGHVKSFNSGFTGIVPDVSVNQSFTGWFSYSSEETLYNTLSGSFEQNASFCFALGDFNFSHVNDYTLLTVTNSIYDFFSLNTYGTQDNIHYLRTGVSFRDNSGTAFSSSAALPNSLDLSMFDSEGCLLNFDSEKSGSMTGVIDTLVLVPEPSSLLILSCGGLLLRRKNI